MTDLFNKTNQAPRRYTRRLSAAFKRGFRIEDPDFASMSDSDAWEKIRRDPVINHAIELRRHAVAGPEWTAQPESDEEQDIVVAQIMEALMKMIRRFKMGRFALAESVFRGSSYAFNLGRRQAWNFESDEPMNWYVPLEFKHVDRWRFQQVPIFDEETRMRGTRWQFYSIRRDQWEDLRSNELSWFTRNFYENTEETLGYGRGILQSLFYYFWAKSVVLEHGLSAVGRWSEGMRIYKIDGAREASTGKPNEEVVDAYLEADEKMRTDHAFVMDKEDEFELKEASGTGHQMVTDFLKYFDAGETQAILASVLPTGGGGDAGSFARAETEGENMEQLFQLDRGLLSESITEGMYGLVFRRNKEMIRRTLEKRKLPMGRMGRFVITNSKVEDPTTNISVASTALASGIKLKEEEVYEKIGYTPPQEDDRVIEPVAPQAAGPLGFQLTPLERREVMDKLVSRLEKQFPVKLAAEMVERGANGSVAQAGG